MKRYGRVPSVLAILVAAGLCAPFGDAGAQGVRYGDAAIPSAIQRDVLNRIAVFTVLRFVADPGPFADDIAEAMNRTMPRAFRVHFPAIPLGEADPRPGADRARQGRLLCSYLAVEQPAPPRVGFAIPCEIGNLTINVAFRRNIAFATPDTLLTSVKAMTEDHLSRLGQLMRQARSER